jgi:adenylylsulfate kinase-like enzyme
MIYWFTGQPGSGKTTLAKALESQIFPKKTICIDGDDLRDIFDNKDYSESGRRKNIERAQEIALFMSKKGYVVLVSLVSPYRDQRETFKSKTDVVEIYVHAFTDRGRTQYHVPNYEPPLENFIDIDTTNSTEMESLREILKKIKI